MFHVYRKVYYEQQPQELLIDNGIQIPQPRNPEVIDFVDA